MRIVLCIAASAFLAVGCARTRPASWNDDTALGAYHPGSEDYSRPRLPKGEGALGGPSVPLPGAAGIALPRLDRDPAAAGWVCEVEARSKVFTGAGGTREEALGSARASCGSHFQASYCTKADCKQSL